MKYNKSGFLGALLQYFTVDEKPRLYPRNTWFEDHQISVENADLFYIVGTLCILSFSVGLVVSSL